MERRLDTPGLFSGSNAMKVSLSVTARLNFYIMTEGSSIMATKPLGLGSDLLIFMEGS